MSDITFVRSASVDQASVATAAAMVDGVWAASVPAQPSPAERTLLTAWALVTPTRDDLASLIDTIFRDEAAIVAVAQGDPETFAALLFSLYQEVVYLPDGGYAAIPSLQTFVRQLAAAVQQVQASPGTPATLVSYVPPAKPAEKSWWSRLFGSNLSAESGDDGQQPAEGATSPGAAEAASPDGEVPGGEGAEPGGQHVVPQEGDPGLTKETGGTETTTTSANASTATSKGAPSGLPVAAKALLAVSAMAVVAVVGVKVVAPAMKD